MCFLLGVININFMSYKTLVLYYGQLRNERHRGKRKGKSIRTESFILVFWTHISLFYHLSSGFPFQKLEKTSLSYQAATETHDHRLAASISPLATLRLLQPVPLPLSPDHLYLSRACGGNVGLSTSLNLLPPGYLSPVASAGFMFLPYTQLLKPTTWDICALFLRVSEICIKHDMRTSTKQLEFYFGHFHNWMNLSLK